MRRPARRRVELADVAPGAEVDDDEEMAGVRVASVPTIALDRHVGTGMVGRDRELVDARVILTLWAGDFPKKELAPEETLVGPGTEPQLGAAFFASSILTLAAGNKVRAWRPMTSICSRERPS